MRAPNLISLVWTGWQLAWSLDVLACLALFAYLTAARRTRGWPLQRSFSFAAGVAAIVVALQSGIDSFDTRLLSDHMVQHLVLLELGPLLLLGGRPVILILRTLPPSPRRRMARALVALRPLTHPVTCLAIFTAVVLGTHLPGFYDATLRHPQLHEFEHVMYVGAGLLMWWPLLDSDPVPSQRLGGFSRLVYLVAAMLPMTVIGSYLSRDPTLFYGAYAGPARSLGVSAVLDQQLAGTMMWVLGGVLMVAAGLWQVMAALVAEERRLQARERHQPRRSAVDPTPEAP